MDDSMRPRLSAGARVTYDGQEWEIAELTPPSVLLAGPAGGLRRVSISHLLAVSGAASHAYPAWRTANRGDHTGTLVPGIALSPTSCALVSTNKGQRA